MSLDALYPVLKALHVAAAFTFGGGVLGVAAFLRALGPSVADHSHIAKGVRRWDQSVTTPAMLLVWTLGLILATTGHWFAAGWLQAKLVVVVVLSGLHGLQSGRLRVLASGVPVRPARATRLSPAVVAVACIIAIALLATVKPA